MVLRSHLLTPIQQSSSFRLGNPDDVDRTSRNKLEIITSLRPTLMVRHSSGDTLGTSISMNDRSPEVGSSKKIVDTNNTIEKANERSLGSVVEDLNTTCIFDNSDESSPNSHKTSQASTLSDPSWRIRRELAKVEEPELRFGASCDNLSSEHWDQGMNQTVNDTQCKSVKKEIFETSKNTAKNFEDTPTYVEAAKIKEIKSNTGSARKREYKKLPHRSLKLNSLKPSSKKDDQPKDSSDTVSSTAVQNVDLPRPITRPHTTTRSNSAAPITFRTEIFDGGSPVSKRPKYARGLSSSWIQHLRRSSRSEDSSSELKVSVQTSKAAKFNNDNRKRLLKPHFLRAHASVPTYMSRAGDMPADLNTTHDSAGHTQRAFRNATPSSEASDSISTPNDDNSIDNDGRCARETMLRRYWSLRSRNSPSFSGYLGTSKRSQLLRDSSPTTSFDEPDTCDGSESQSTSGVTSPKLEPQSTLSFHDSRAWFRVQMGSEDTESDEERVQFHLDIPEHLPNSPLCPLNTKYRGKPMSKCPRHGRRRTLVSSDG